MISKDKNLKPNISSTAFWDVDFENIDFQNSSAFVINKVFNYSKLSDIVALFHFYRRERIRKEVLESSYYKKTALSFLCTVLNLEESDFVNLRKPSMIWNQ